MIFMACGHMMHAQQYITISGKAVDSNTGEPLIFASIGIKGRSIGTISNTIGEFDFHIPAESINELLQIHMIGYETFEMKVADIIASNMGLFRMNKSTKVLDEVVISDSLTGADIFKIALNRIPVNYPMVPFMLDGFYRDLKNVGGTYVALLEAAIKIYDKDYSIPKNKYRLRERVALIEVRKSLGYNHKFTTFYDQTNLLEDLLIHNNIRYHQFSDEEIFYTNLTRTRTDYMGGKRVFVLDYKGNTRLRLYIDALTYAIIRMEYQTGEQDEIIDKRKGLISRLYAMEKIIEFKEYAGKMYLYHINLKSDIHWYDEKTNEMRFNTQLHQQLLINKIFPNSEEKIGTTEKMKRYGLQYQHSEYNKEFWDNYNVIKETPLDKQIVEDLESEVSLEKQFQNN